MSAIEYREFVGPIDDDKRLRLGALACQVFPVSGQPERSVAGFADQLGIAVNGHQWVHLCAARPCLRST